MHGLMEAYVKAQGKLQQILKQQEGATLVEYALMLALIAVFCVSAVTLLGTESNTKFTDMASSISR